MYRSFETNRPLLQIVTPKIKGGSLTIKRISIDIARATKDDTVRIYLADKANRFVVYRLWAQDTSMHSDVNTNIAGWSGAQIEIETTGFGRFFVGVEFEEDRFGRKKLASCIDQDTAPLRTYTMKTKVKEVR